MLGGFGAAGESKGTFSVPSCNRLVTGLDLPGIKPPAPRATSPFPRRRAGAACTLPRERLHAHSCGVACGLLGRESEEPREQAADPTSGSRGSRLLQVLNPCRRASA